jgi:hypothetical protein
LSLSLYLSPNSSNMKISIIGGGWLGCHISSKLKTNHDVTLFDKAGIFNGSSFYNQNRLHKGFHYSRNQKTRKLCYDTFDLFQYDYKHLVTDIPNNYYVVPLNKSLIDFGTFKTIFEYDKIPFKESNLCLLSNIEGSIIVDEKYINPIKSKNYFESNLKDVFVKKEIKIKDLDILSKENDLVINVTNNILHPIPNHYYELSLTLIYEKLVENEFGSITMVDGPLFSIYPYKHKKYTVTDVQYTPMYISENIEDVIKYKDTINFNMIKNIKSKIEEKILFYYGGFKTHFKYEGYYTSIKVKNHSESADRSPLIIKENNIISSVTGKIQGIYVLENYIKNEIINR